MTDARRALLSTLTGIRSGKESYYRAYVRSDERMNRAVTAMDSISRALVRTVEGPRGLLEEVARAAAAHLDAEWTLLALSDGHLRGARPRFLVIDRDLQVHTEVEEVPEEVREELGAVRAGRLSRPATEESGWVRVPMTLDGRGIGSLVARHGLTDPPEAEDLSVLRILANQAAVSLHTSEQYQAGLALHRRAQRLYAEATLQARDLAARTAELRRAEELLLVATRRELLDGERHRIARELHDSVSQYVLSAGMAVEVARGQAEAFGPEGRAIAERLETAKQFTQEAVEQLRRAIYSLHLPHHEEVTNLPELLQEVAEQHTAHVAVTVRIEGGVQPLDVEHEHEIARAVGEALFNVTMHAQATRAVLRLRYRPDEILVTVSDDGRGDPRELTRLLRLERSTTVDGRHRGLANMESRVHDLGGSFRMVRARIGGVRIEMRVPLPIPPRAVPTFATPPDPDLPRPQEHA